MDERNIIYLFGRFPTEMYYESDSFFAHFIDSFEIILLPNNFFLQQEILIIPGSSIKYHDIPTLYQLEEDTRKIIPSSTIVVPLNSTCFIKSSCGLTEFEYSLYVSNLF